jgi:hypothetical protein
MLGGCNILSPQDTEDQVGYPARAERADDCERGLAAVINRVLGEGCLRGQVIVDMAPIEPRGPSPATRRQTPRRPSSRWTYYDVQTRWLLSPSRRYRRSVGASHSSRRTPTAAAASGARLAENGRRIAASSTHLHEGKRMRTRICELWLGISGGEA